MEKQNIIFKEKNRFLKNRYYINNDSLEYTNFVYFNRKRKLSLNTKNNYKNILFKYYFNNYNKIESKIKIFLSKIVEYIYSVVKLIKIYKYFMLSKLRFFYMRRLRRLNFKNNYKFRRNKITINLKYRSYIKYYRYKITRKFKGMIRSKMRIRKRKLWSYFWENIRLLRKFKFSKFIKKFIFNVFKNKYILKLTMRKTKMDLINYLSFFLLILEKQYMTRRRRRRKKKNNKNKKKYRVTVNELLIKNNLTYKNDKINNKLFNLYSEDILSNFINFYNNRFMLKNYIELNYYKLKNYLLYILIKKLFKKKKTLKFFYIYLFYYHNNSKLLLLSKSNLLLNLDNKIKKKINIRNFIEITYFLKQTKYLLKEHRLTFNSFTQKFKYFEDIKKDNTLINVLITYVDNKNENVYYKFNEVIKKYQIILSNLMHYKNDIIEKEKYYSFKLFYFLSYYNMYFDNENIINFVDSIIKSSFFITKNIKLKKFNFIKKFMFYKEKLIQHLYINSDKIFKKKNINLKFLHTIKRKLQKVSHKYFIHDFYKHKFYHKIVKYRLVKGLEFIWSRKNDVYKKNYIPIYNIYDTKKNKIISKKKLHNKLYKNISK